MLQKRQLGMQTVQEISSFTLFLPPSQWMDWTDLLKGILL